MKGYKIQISYLGVRHVGFPENWGVGKNVIFSSPFLQNFCTGPNQITCVASYCDA